MFSALADGMLHGKQLYRELWDHKPPGVIWLYAGAIALFGRGYAAIHTLQALFVIATALLIAWLIRATTGRLLAGALAAMLYVLHAGGLAFGGFWGTAQAEVFMDLPIVTALLLLFLAREHADRGAWVQVALSGVCIGSTLLLKYSALPLLLLVVLAWPARGIRPAPRILAFALGCALPPILLGLGMVMAGTWDDFYRATVTFNMDYRSAIAAGRPSIIASVLYSPGRLLALLVPAGLAVVAALRPGGSKPGGADGAARLARIGLLLWLLALGEVFWQGRYWVYHYHVVLLPLALLAGAGLAAASISWRSRMAPVALCAALAACSVPYARELRAYDRGHGLSARWSGAIDAAAMEATYTWGDYEFAQTKAVAAEIAKAVPAGEPVFIWGFEPYVYFLSQRPSASRFQNDEPLMPRYVSVHPVFTAELMDDLRRHPPSLVVVLTHDANDVEPEDSVRQLLAWSDLRQFVESRYAPAWRTGDFLCLARRPDVR